MYEPHRHGTRFTFTEFRLFIAINAAAAFAVGLFSV